MKRASKLRIALWLGIVGRSLAAMATLPAWGLAAAAGHVEALASGLPQAPSADHPLQSTRA